MSILSEKGEQIRQTFADNLKKELARKGKTQADLVAYLGVSKGAVSQWCNGRSVPSAQTAIKIAEWLNIKLSDLTDDKKPNATFTPFIQAPLYESISAGFGTTKAEPIGTHPCVVHNQEEAEQTLCVTVEGDSMSPKIENGDIIQIRQQRSVDSGDIAAVLLDNEEYFVKKVEYGVDYIRLISINMNYAPIVLRGSDVQRCFVLGKVVAITKRC